MSSHPETTITALLNAHVLAELDREPLSTAQVVGRLGFLATPELKREIESLLARAGFERRETTLLDDGDVPFKVYRWHAGASRRRLHQGQAYVGQPNPGASIPLPSAPPSPASPYGKCACGKPADAMVRQIFQQPQPACAACAARLGVHGVIPLHLLNELPDTFRIEHAMRVLNYGGTGLGLARTLSDFGFHRRRDGDGFVWQRPRIAA
ncbi:hypothetical protein [Sphingomonas sp. OTU376]|uniref:hypothetical protein n=1 Tax=Sphingomonas sp. OTU376 TaxID=3043863 RepID=UPI00313C9655